MTILLRLLFEQYVLSRSQAIQLTTKQINLVIKGDDKNTRNNEVQRIFMDI